MTRPGVRRLRLLDGAREANGSAVIIDVFRAATTCAYALAGGARRVLLVASAAEGLELRAARFPDAVLVGESGGVALAGYDLDNSPTLLERADVRGRAVILRTSSGTQGVLAASRAERVYLAGFVNASATAAVLRARSGVASLVAMGEGGEVPAEEDEAAAAYIESLLRGRPLPIAALIADVRRGISGDHPAPTWRGDVERALATDRFDFAISIDRADGLAVASPVRPSP